MKQYEKSLEKINKISGKEEIKVRRLEPVWREPDVVGPIMPPPIIHPRNSNNPFEIPFQGGEYVGPNSNLFRGANNNNNPQMQGPQGMRRPPGARFDPIDPFSFDENPRVNDFSGFNQWGQPKGNRFNPFE